MKEGADEALQRARTHLRQATLEGLEGTRALVEAAARASGLANPASDSLIAAFQANLDEMIAGLRKNASFALPNALAEPLAAAIDAEIARWEKRSQTDADARPVLRVFLGLREMLWEIGMRRETPAANPEDRPKKTSNPPERNRVQHFDIED